MRYYTDEHEWIEVEGDIATVGITDYAQGQLGDIVFVELPEVGAMIEQGKDAAVVESVKAASDVYAPITGEITEVNPALEEDPALVNTSPATRFFAASAFMWRSTAISLACMGRS